MADAVQYPARNQGVDKAGAQSVDRMPDPVVLLWVGLVVGGHLWAGLKGLAFTGPIALIVLPATRWRSLVERVPGPVVTLLWVGLVAGGYLWTGLKGLVFTGAIALGLAGMVMVRRWWRPKEPPKTWVGIFWSCWGLFMYSSNGAEWSLTMPAVWALTTLTAWRHWPPKVAAAAGLGTEPAAPEPPGEDRGRSPG